MIKVDYKNLSKIIENNTFNLNNEPEFFIDLFIELKSPIKTNFFSEAKYINYIAVYRMYNEDNLCYLPIDENFDHCSHEELDELSILIINKCILENKNKLIQKQF